MGDGDGDGDDASGKMIWGTCGEVAPLVAGTGLGEIGYGFDEDDD